MTIVWPDDNYGYLRRISNAEEQKRSGGSGVYYHLSYWGRPHDYLWLSTTQLGLIWYEMTRAYQNGAKKIWIANVGDIKPAEYNIELFLDLAWDVTSIDNTTIKAHLQAWAGREFRAEFRDQVAEVMHEYYRLAFLRRPEFMGWSGVEPQTDTKASAFQGEGLQRRLDSYQALQSKVDALKKQLPKERLASWFQLVEYPVKAASLMNQKFLYSQRASETTAPAQREEYMRLAEQSFDGIKALTAYYNNELSAGKWQNMMSMKPRGLSVFEFLEHIIEATARHEDTVAASDAKQRIYLQANEHIAARASHGFAWKSVGGLGYSNAATTLFPLQDDRFDQEQPYLEYSFEAAQAGAFELQVRLLPTHSNAFTHQITLQIDSQAPQSFHINTKGRSEQWKENVLRNAQIIKLESRVEKAGKHTIRLSVNQTGIVVDQLAIDFDRKNDFYEIPLGE